MISAFILKLMFSNGYFKTERNQPEQSTDRASYQEKFGMKQIHKFLSEKTRGINPILQECKSVGSIRQTSGRMIAGLKQIDEKSWHDFGINLEAQTDNFSILATHIFTKSSGLE